MHTREVFYEVVKISLPIYARECGYKVGSVVRGLEILFSLDYSRSFAYYETAFTFENATMTDFIFFLFPIILNPLEVKNIGLLQEMKNFKQLIP